MADVGGAWNAPGLRRIAKPAYPGTAGMPPPPPPGSERFRIYAETSLIGVEDFRTFAVQVDCTHEELSAGLQDWVYELVARGNLWHVYVTAPRPGTRGRGDLIALKSAARALPAG